MSVLIFRGMTVGILPGDCVISFAESGGLESKLILSTAYNVIPLWLRIARDSLNDAKAACDSIAQNWTDNADSQKALLVAELAPSMQVIVSCGIALDALYGMLKPYAKLTADDVNRWTNNRTGRGAQIAEVARRVLRFKNEQVKDVKKAITEIVKFRDMAVHPTLELKNALTRPDLNVAVDWKFSAYRFANAQACFNTTMQIFIFAYQKMNLEEKLVSALKNIFDALEELGVVKINTQCR